VTRLVATLAVITLAGVLVVAEERVDEKVIAQIKAEGFQHSQVMDTLSWLSDVYGPRLTGSPQLERAAQWARDQLSRWGLERAALEPYGDIGRGWALEGFDIQMTEPQWMRITGYPLAWSPAIPTPLVGTPIVVEGKKVSDLAKYRGKLRGAIVMDGRPGRIDIGFNAEAKRYSNDELTKQEGAIDPAPEVRRG
jgi:carboxypeptidase Q